MFVYVGREKVMAALCGEEIYVIKCTPQFCATICKKDKPNYTKSYCSADAFCACMYPCASSKIHEKHKS